jgi:DNA-binding CsgD family transcriptional regulator
MLLFSVFILACGSMGSVLGLSAALWIKRREQKLFKTQLFLFYLTVLFFLSGLRFGLGVFADWNGPGITLFFELLERAAFASLIYFLPATINYLLGRRWTKGRLVQVLAAAVVYLVSGVVSLLTGGSMLPGMLAVLAFLLIILFVLVDASRSLPMVRDEGTRVSLFLLYGITFVFLPLAQILPLIVDGYERAVFLAGALYYLAIGISANIFFLRALTSNDSQVWDSDNTGFLYSCGKAGLTTREIEIAGLISRGFTYKEIAAELDISPNTVSNHIGTIYRKTGTRSKVEMVNALRGAASGTDLA